jgi:hypothetical protein
MLAVRPSKVREALLWLKDHNHLYHDVTISDDNLRPFEDQVSDNVPRLFYDNIECIQPSAQDRIESSHYVSAAERGVEVESGDFAGAENNNDINELLAELRSNKGVSSDLPVTEVTDIDMEEESPEDELHSEPQFTWSGCLDVDSQMEGGLVQRIRDVESLLQNPNSNGTEDNRAGESSYLLSGSRTGEPFIISRRGCEFEL